MVEAPVDDLTQIRLDLTWDWPGPAALYYWLFCAVKNLHWWAWTESWGRGKWVAASLVCCREIPRRRLRESSCAASSECSPCSPPSSVLNTMTLRDYTLHKAHVYFILFSICKCYWETYWKKMIGQRRRDRVQLQIISNIAYAKEMCTSNWNSKKKTIRLWMKNQTKW